MAKYLEDFREGGPRMALGEVLDDSQRHLVELKQHETSICGHQYLAPAP